MFLGPDSAHLLLLCLVEVDTRALLRSLRFAREGGREGTGVQSSRQSLRGWGTARSGYQAEINWQNGKVWLMDKVSLLAGGWNAGDYFWSGELGWFIDLADRLSLMFRVFWRIGRSIGIIGAYSYLDYSDKIIDEMIYFRFF